MGDESSLDASEQYEFISYILELYKKSWDNVACLVGDNCTTNKAVANKAARLLIGYASHRLNLAVILIIGEDNVLIEKINAIMTKLKHLLLAAKLYKINGLRARAKNETRWSFVFEMLLQYEKIREYLAELCSDELDDIRLMSAETRTFIALIERLRDLESVTKALQEEKTTIGDVRVIFDAVIEKFPEIAEKLDIDAAIVHSPEFESGIFKIQLGNEAALELQERAAFSRFLRASDEEDSLVSERLSLAQFALQRQKRTASVDSATYGDLRVLLSTSNVCECLFSKAGYALNDRRKTVFPAKFESQIFLHLNSDLWTACDLSSVDRQ